jgi:hypothetical protein
LANLWESGLFGPPEYAEFRHEQRFDPDGLVERVASISYVALLEGREREEFLAQVRELGERRVSPFAFSVRDADLAEPRRLTSVGLCGAGEGWPWSFSRSL